MEKHPSSLAALAEFFIGFGGNIFKWLLLFWNTFGGKRRKMGIIWQILPFLIKNIISSAKYYICTEVLQFLIFADIKYFHQWPCLDEISSILPIEAYFQHFSIVLDMSRITPFLVEIINPKILLAETFKLFPCLPMP